MFNLALNDSLAGHTKFHHGGHNSVQLNIGILIDAFPEMLKNHLLQGINVPVDLNIQNNILFMVD